MHAHTGWQPRGDSHSVAWLWGVAVSPSTDWMTLLNTPHDCLLSFLSHFGCDSSFGSRWQRKSHYSQNISGFWIQSLSKRLPLTSCNIQSLSQGSGAEIRYFCCYWKLTILLCVGGVTSVQISVRLSVYPEAPSGEETCPVIGCSMCVHRFAPLPQGLTV